MVRRPEPARALLCGLAPERIDETAFQQAGAQAKCASGAEILAISLRDRFRTQAAGLNNHGPRFGIAGHRSAPADRIRAHFARQHQPMLRIEDGDELRREPKRIVRTCCNIAVESACCGARHGFEEVTAGAEHDLALETPTIELRIVLMRDAGTADAQRQPLRALQMREGLTDQGSRPGPKPNGEIGRFIGITPRRAAGATLPP